MTMGTLTNPEVIRRLRVSGSFEKSELFFPSMQRFSQMDSISGSALDLLLE